jgi:hypothetical protein
MSDVPENPTPRFVHSIDPKLDRIGDDVRVRSVCERRNALHFSAVRAPSPVGHCFNPIDEHPP